MNNNPHLVEKSGVLIEEKAAEKANIQSLAVAFDQTEVQDLHGYAKPWIGGEGKNLFDKDNATAYSRAINDTLGTWVSYNATSYAFECEANTDYIVSAFHDELDLFKVAYITSTLPQSSAEEPTVYNLTSISSQGSILIHTGANATYIIMQPKSTYAATTLIQIEKLSTNLFDTSTATQKWVYPTSEINNRPDALTEEFAVTAGQRICLCADVVASTSNVYMIAFLDSSNAILSRKVATSGYSLFSGAPTGAITCITGFSDYTAAGITTPVLSKYTLTYEPYENYCPILGGIAGCTITHTGKNIALGIETGYGYDNDTGVVYETNLRAITEKVAVDFSQNARYCFSTDVSGANNMIHAWDANGDYVGRMSGASDSVRTINKSLFSRGNGNKDYDHIKWIAIAFYVNSGTIPSSVLTAHTQLEAGSAATTYESPLSEVIPVSWEATSGLMYKGTLNLVTGVLTATDALMTFTGQESWTHAWGTSSSNGAFRLNPPPILPSSGSNFIANFDVYTGRGTSGYTNHGIYINVASHYLNVRNWMSQDRGSSTASAKATEWKNYLAARYAAGKPLQILCKGANKQYQLTPQQIKTLFGKNYIWSNVGTCTAKYWAH